MTRTGPLTALGAEPVWRTRPSSSVSFVPSFNIMYWPEGRDPGTWMPVAQAVSAPTMREAVERIDPGPGRYKVVVAAEGNHPSGLVKVDEDGTAHDVDAF